MRGSTTCILYQGQKLIQAHAGITQHTPPFQEHELFTTQTRRTHNIFTLTHQYTSHITLLIFNFLLYVAV